MRRFAWVLLGVFALLPAFTAAQVRIVRMGEPIRPPAPDQPKPEQAAGPAVEAVEPTKEEASRIADLIEQLGAARLATRDRAMAELATFAEKALRQVREAKKHQDDEIANRCEILEEVISSRQAELYLAARRLSLEPKELERLLNAEDVKPLLDLLKSRAQPGMTPVWARVLGKLAARPQVVMAAQLCIAAEGAEGYGIALAGAGKQAMAAHASAAGLVSLASLLPPGRALDAVNALSWCATAIGGAEGLQGALQAAFALRGTYPVADVLAAIKAPDEAGKPQVPEAESVRHAIALCLAPACTDAELAAAQVPALASMSTLALQEYLKLLARSGLAARVESALVALVAAGASPRALSLAGSAWAGAVPMARLEADFAALPHAARIGALDALWLSPREPARAQKFLAGLLSGRDAGLRATAARMLAQYRAPSTARMLAESALADADTAQFALESLHPMAELLPAAAPKQLEDLSALLKTAGAATRPPLLLTLVAARHEPSCRALLAQWKQHLPRHEALPACILLARDQATAAGACAAVLMLDAQTRHERAWQLAQIDSRQLALLRAVLSSPQAEALALLARVASDEASELRGFAAATLALCGQDGAQISDWIRRLAGEIPDRQPQSLALAVGLSSGKPADDFRARVMQQGSGSPHMHVAVLAVQHGRTKAITAAQLAAALYDTPAGALNWVGFAESLPGPLPPEALKNLATGLLFAEDTPVLDSAATALFLAETGADVQQLLFGDDSIGAPRDGARLTLVALMGNPGKAAQLMAKAETAEDGSNYSAIQFARAWLGTLAPADNERLVRGAGNDETLRLFALRRQAMAGSTQSLRALMDCFGSQSGRFAPGATAGVVVNTDGWSNQGIEFEGVAAQVLASGGADARVPRGLLGRMFAQPPAEDWDTWWQTRRALLVHDAAGKFKFEELP